MLNNQESVQTTEAQDAKVFTVNISTVSAAPASVKAARPSELSAAQLATVAGDVSSEQPYTGCCW